MDESQRGPLLRLRNLLHAEIARFCRCRQIKTENRRASVCCGDAAIFIIRDIPPTVLADEITVFEFRVREDAWPQASSEAFDMPH